MNQPQQTPPRIVHRKASDFDGVLEEYFDPREDVKKAKAKKIVGISREELENHKTAMLARHKNEVEAMDKIFDILNGKNEKKAKHAKTK